MTHTTTLLGFLYFYTAAGPDYHNDSIFYYLYNSCHKCLLLNPQVVTGFENPTIAHYEINT